MPISARSCAKHIELDDRFIYRNAADVVVGWTLTKALRPTQIRLGVGIKSKAGRILQITGVSRNDRESKTIGASAGKRCAIEMESKGRGKGLNVGRDYHQHVAFGVSVSLYHRY